VLALGCAIAIWLLGIAAYSPQLHASVHGHPEHAEGCSHEGGPASPDHACAITLFQHGVETPLSAVFVRSEPASNRTLAISWSESIPRPAADLRLHSGQAPPAP